MGTRTVLFVAFCSLAGACASAGNSEETGRPDGGGLHPLHDAPAGTAPDASGQMHDAFVPIDGAVVPNSVTLSQTTSATLTSRHAIACPGSDGVGTSQNSYYRVFDLAAAGITTAFVVSKVSFQIEDSESAAGNGSVVAVRVGTYTGTPGATLTPASIVVASSNDTVQVPEVDEVTTSPGGTVDAPVTATIPAGSQMVVEVDSADGTDLWQFYMGTNAGGESGKSYISTQSQCTNPGKTPKVISAVAAAEVDLLLTVTGTAQ